MSRAPAACRQMDEPPEPIPNTPVPTLPLSTCFEDISLQATTVHTMLPGTRSMCGAVVMDDGKAASSGGVEGRAVGNAQVALGKVLLGREKMSLGKQGSCATPSLWDWPQHPEKTFFGALTKAQGVVMPLSQGVTCAGCVSAQDGASTHTHPSLSQSILQREASLFDFNTSCSGKLTAVLGGVFQQLPILHTCTWLAGSASPAQLQPLQLGISLESLSAKLTDPCGHPPAAPLCPSTC